MPIYEYRCEDCGTKFEKLVRSAGAAGVRCPSCGEQRLALQLSVFATRSQAPRGNPCAEAGPGGCPAAGMCRTPEMCGLN